MRLSSYIAQVLLFGVLSQTVPCPGQQRNLPSIPGPAFAQGQLTVTLTVISSVGIVFDSQGEPKLMEANCASRSDNVSWLQPAQPSAVQTLRQAQAETRDKKQKASHKQ